MTELNISLKVTITLHEIKHLVIDNIEKAHDISNPYCLSKCKQYNQWHSPLIKFYEENKTTQPTMADKLCFVILLSYPKHIIESLNDISDIKLFDRDNTDNTDFIYNQEFCLNHEEEQGSKYDCICSYEKLQKIHFVENKYSGISLQVGSECITKHNLISREEIKKFKETDKLLKEKRKEIKDGKPLGYFKEERKRKEEEKRRKKEEKEEEKRRKKEEKIKTGNFKRCYTCDENIVDIRKDTLCICNKCKNKNYEKLCCQIKKHGLNECANCNNNFIDVIQNDPSLCKNCKSQNKIIKCHMSLCSELMVVDINTNNVFCDDCEKKIITCIDCKIGFIQDSCESRCDYCQYSYENKLVNKTCVVCNEEMAVKQTELWRTYCTTCYRKVQDTIKDPPKCNCGLNMIPRTIKRGENQGRKGLGCPRYPNGCNKFQIL